MGNSYYPQYFISQLGNFTSRQLGNSPSSFVSKLAPVGGRTSAKIKSLNTILGGQLNNIIAGHGQFSSLGQTARARVLKALHLRKNGVTFG